VTLTLFACQPVSGVMSPNKPSGGVLDALDELSASAECAVTEMKCGLRAWERSQPPGAARQPPGLKKKGRSRWRRDRRFPWTVTLHKHV